MIPLRDINPTRIRPIFTLALIAISVAVYFGLQPADLDESARFSYQNAAIACELTTGDPLDTEERINDVCSNASLGSQDFPGKNVYASVIFSMFFHGSILHLLGNMWFLWIFGNNIEEAFGRFWYLVMYLASGIAATIGFVALNADSTIPLVGASGAIAGVMGSYLVLFPTHRVLTIIFFAVVGVPAILFLGLWFFGQFALVGQESGIAWEAHVFGFIFGVLITLPLRSVLLRRTAGSVGELALR